MCPQADRPGRLSHDVAAPERHGRRARRGTTRRLHLDAPPREAARLIVSALEGAMLVARPYGDVERFHAAATGLLATMARPAPASSERVGRP